MKWLARPLPGKLCNLTGPWALLQKDPNEKVSGLVCKHICNLIVQSVDTSGSLGCTLGNSRDTGRPKLHYLKGIMKSMVEK